MKELWKSIPIRKLDAGSESVDPCVSELWALGFQFKFLKQFLLKIDYSGYKFHILDFYISNLGSGI